MAQQRGLVICYVFILAIISLSGCVQQSSKETGLELSSSPSTTEYKESIPPINDTSKTTLKIFSYLNSNPLGTLDNGESMGINNITWINDTVLQIQVNIGLTRGEEFHGADYADYEIKENKITLKYKVLPCCTTPIDGGNLCRQGAYVLGVIYQFTDLPKKEYTFELQRTYIPIQNQTP